MAKILGHSGKYVSEEAARQRRKILLVAFTVIAFLGMIAGVSLASFLPLPWMDSWVRLALMSAAILTIVAVDAWGEKKLEVSQKRSDALLRNAVGALQVGNLIGGLPGEFRVINDLSTPVGIIRHIVVGPTGVFLMESKNWRGVVSDDGKGELLLNDRPTEMPYIRYFKERVAKVRNNIRLPEAEMSDFVSILFVFTSARVEVMDGGAAGVICLEDEKIYSFIMERETSRKLSEQEVDAIAQAFLEFGRHGALPGI